jgi:uncharacterized protein YbjQ (UPF0145 family)
MPFGFGKSAEEKQQEAQRKEQLAADEQRATASLDSLARGGIPVEALKRLQDPKLRDGSFFTSDLSVNEFLLTQETKLRPISQVMGSSIYHVGWRGVTFYTPSGEMSGPTTATNQARSLALRRMSQEASLLGAHVVAGVRPQLQRYEWASGLIEFSFVGTAMRFDGLEPAESASLTNLSGQDVWKLYVSGYWPLGVVAGSSVFHVRPNWNTRRASASTIWGSGRNNQELTDFTAGVYAARHLASRYLHEDAERLSCSGIVGMVIDQEAEEVEVSSGNNNERTDMVFTFHAMGTAVTERVPQHTIPPIRQTIDLRRESSTVAGRRRQDQ